MGPAARARLAASHVPPARARIELLCPSEASTHRKLRLRRRHSPEFLCWKTTRIAILQSQDQNKKTNTSVWAL